MTSALIRLERKDIPQAAAVHARAFLPDPYTTYALRDIRKRPRQLLDLMGITLRYACSFGEIYATPGMEAVAAWMPPGSGRESYWRMMRVGALPLIWRIGLPVIRSYLQVETITNELHSRYAPEPHWYLSQLGVEPELQGKGYGQRVLLPTLEQIDAEDKMVYLETLNPRALPFYRKLGFQVCEEVQLPNGGPPMWSMLRPETGKKGHYHNPGIKR
jgi:ribosomal protein S18 acetylase RimI-like enzyme